MIAQPNPSKVPRDSRVSTKFHPHLALAHSSWKSIVTSGDTIIDATCGNGHDALFLAQLLFQEDNKGTLFAFDIQPEAIEATRKRLETGFQGNLPKNICFITGCHSSFPQEVAPNSVKLIVYNLGYLPGGDKSKTTMLETTSLSINKACDLITKGGLISITFYPGHPEGQKEETIILEEIAKLDPQKWNCCHHRWINRKQSPTLLLIQSIM